VKLNTCAQCSVFCPFDEEKSDRFDSDYYTLLDALISAILELQAIVVDLRREVDVWNPNKPYQHDLLSDINVCFDDYSIAKLYPDLFCLLH
jgi:hypothetical protein